MHRRRGLSLLEMTVAVSVIAIMAAATLPLMAGAADTLEASGRLGDSSRSTAYAMERVLAMLRAAPPSSDDESLELDIASMTPESIVFGDGHGVVLAGDALELREAGGEGFVLCRGVETFEIVPTGSDGVSGTMSQPGATWRFEVRLRVGGFELRSVAMPRVRMVPG